MALKQIKMFCDQCKDKEKPAFRCCSTILCLVHFNQHFATNRNHQPVPLAFNLSKSDELILNIEIQSRIKTLENLKSKLRHQCKLLMLNIEELENKLLKNFDNLIVNYLQIMR